MHGVAIATDDEVRRAAVRIEVRIAKRADELAGVVARDAQIQI
jgi:hypothetical protein